MIEEFELRECPFCQGEAKLSYVGTRIFHIGCFNVGCTFKPVRIFYDTNVTPEYAAKKWNQRLELYEKIV